MIFEMDWYFDIIVLVGTFCVIAIGMTIYARLHPTRPRVRRSHYIYTGIIPTITISGTDTPAKSSPTTLTPADSIDVEDDENKPKKSESPVDNTEVKSSENNRLAIPILDDDDEDEEEQQQSTQFQDVSNSVANSVGNIKNKVEAVSVTTPPVEVVENNKEEKKNKREIITVTSKPVGNEGSDKKIKSDTVTGNTPPIDTVTNNKENSKNNTEVTIPSSIVENVEKVNDSNLTKTHLFSAPVHSVTGDDGDSKNENATRLLEDAIEKKEPSNTALLFDKSDEEDHSHSASLSPIDNEEDELSDSMDLSDILTNYNDLRSSPEPLPNTSLRKIGTSHTVEEPLFPFSEILEEENPSTRNRFKKRLSQ